MSRERPLSEVARFYYNTTLNSRFHLSPNNFASISSNKRSGSKYESTIEKGEDAEKRCVELLEAIPMIKSVKKAKDEDDQRGIDYWINFVAGFVWDKLPLQAKSSQSGIDSFKESHQYRNLSERVIILNMGWFKSNEEIFDELFCELDRIYTLDFSESSDISKTKKVI